MILTHHPKKILVTGSAGFIGSNFVRLELQANADIKIISLDKLTYAGNLRNLDDLPNAHNHIFIQGDIVDATLVNHIVAEHQIDTIVHFAAESHVDRSIENPHAFIETNVLGTFNLLQAALKVKNYRFHHISTDEVYGSLEKNDKPFTEKHAYQPNSPYSASKAGSDHLVRAFAHTYGLPMTISNCSNNYGPNQHVEKLIPTIINACLNKKIIPIYGAGKNIRDWIFVEDHCRAVSLIIRYGSLNNTYNIGGQCEMNNLDLARVICDLMGASHRKLIQFVRDRPGHDFRYAIDNQKIQNELSWKPSVSLQAGLQKTIDFYAEK